MSGIFNLQRFITAQENVYDAAIEELTNGHKQTHWMWFIFPQIDGLGKSPTAKQYAIQSLDEAKAYLNHPILGQRLIACTRCVLDINDRTTEQIFGYPDNLKFHSCMTLFSQASGDEPIFKKALIKYYAGREDEKTLRLLA